MSTEQPTGAQVIPLTKMTDAGGGSWQVTLTMNSVPIVSPARVAAKVGDKWVAQPAREPDLQPRVILSGEGSFGGHEYNAAAFLDTASRGFGFFIAVYGPGQSVSFTFEETSRVAQLIRAAVPTELGRFAVTWEPNDPSVPF